MRIAHISDQHFGPGQLAEAERCMSAAVDRTIQEQVDAVVLTGDLTAHAMETHCPALHAAARHVRRLADHFPVLLLQGTFSHEPLGSLQMYRLFGGRYPIYVAERLEQVALMKDGSWCPSPSWAFDEVPAGDVRALFTCVPTVNKAHVAAAVGGAAAPHALGDQLAQVLAGYGPVNAAARRRGIPTVGIGHGTVSGCITEHGKPMLGLDHEFSLGALFAAECDAFALGHIHKFQSWERDGRMVAYAGSTGAFHYGEEGTKGFLLWAVEPGRASAILAPTPARRTVDLAFAGPPDLAELASRAANGSLAGAAVRVRWTVGEDERHRIDRKAIARLLGESGVLEVKFDGRILPVQRTRAPGIAQSDDLAVQISAWARATDCEPAPLLDCLARLQTDDPEAIARAILDLPAPAPLADAPLRSRREQSVLFA